MVVNNPASNESTGSTTSKSSSTTQNSPSPLTFGDFGTQICGAWSMLLLHAQGKMAKMGSEIAQDFTKEQVLSYKGQNDFLQGGMQASYIAAERQKAQMEMQAASEFASAGTSALGLGLTAGAARGWPGVKKLCPENAKLNNAQDKLTQQKSLLKSANEKRNDSPSNMSFHTKEKSTDATPQEVLINNRKDELLGHGGSVARELGTKSVQGTGKHAHLSGNEETVFPQKEFDSDKGNFYRKKADVTDEEAGEESKTRGAYLLKDLDEQAIQSMNPEERKAFIDKLERHVGQTEGTIQTLTTKVSMFQQNLQQVMTVLSSGLKGTFGMYAAADGAEAKQQEANSAIANQDAGVAGGVTQALASTKEGVLRNVEQAMQGFGGTYQSMRG